MNMTREERALGSLTVAVTDVILERKKQREKWGDTHDDEHDNQAMAAVASRLAYPFPEPCGCREAFCPHTGFFEPPSISIPAPPWADDLARKHPSRRDQLVIAAALLIAEIERLDRTSKPKETT